MSDDSLDRIIESLSQINVNLESLRVTLAGVSEVTVDHEQRLRRVEIWKHNLSPVIAAMTFALGAIFSAAVASFF